MTLINELYFYLILLISSGVLIYLFTLLIFDISVCTEVKVIHLFLSLIPVIGAILNILLLGFCMQIYQRKSFYDCNSYTVRVRDNKMTRYLFNDIDWEDYDKFLKNK